MVSCYKVQVTLPRKSGVAADAVVNTLYLTKGTPMVATDFDNARDNISDFYGAVPTGAAQSISGWMSGALDATANAASIRFYLLPAVAGPVGSPVATRQFTLGATAATSLPAEIALCLSYRRTYGTDVEFGASGLRPRASDRGRLYLGPLATASMTTDATTKEARFDATALPQIAVKAAHQSLGTAMTADSLTWVQFSHKHWSFDAVVSCWADNAPDVIRGRGNKATITYTEAV